MWTLMLINHYKFCVWTICQLRNLKKLINSKKWALELTLLIRHTRSICYCSKWIECDLSGRNKNSCPSGYRMLQNYIMGAYFDYCTIVMDLSKKPIVSLFVLHKTKHHVHTCITVSNLILMCPKEEPN